MDLQVQGGFIFQTAANIKKVPASAWTWEILSREKKGKTKSQKSHSWSPAFWIESIILRGLANV